MKRRWILAMLAVASFTSSTAVADEADDVAKAYVERFANIVSQPFNKGNYFDATCRLLQDGINVRRWVNAVGAYPSGVDAGDLDDNLVLGYMAAFMLDKSNYFKEHRGKKIEWIRVGANRGTTWARTRVRATTFKVRAGGDDTEIYVHNGRIFDMFVTGGQFTNSAGSELSNKGSGVNAITNAIKSFNKKVSGGKERCP